MKTEYKPTIIIIALVALLSLIMLFLTRGDVFLMGGVIIGAVIGIPVVVYLLGYYEAPPKKEVRIENYGNVMIETPRSPNSGNILIPKWAGSFFGTDGMFGCDLTLTDMGIVAKKESATLFFLPLISIVTFSMEKKLRAHYIRITYRDLENKFREILLFTGDDTEKWYTELKRLTKRNARY